MLQFYVMLLTLTTLVRDTARARLAHSRDDRGVVTLETVVVALGLFLLATGVVAVIKNAVDSRVGNIK